MQGQSRLRRVRAGRPYITNRIRQTIVPVPPTFVVASQIGVGQWHLDESDPFICDVGVNDRGRRGVFVDGVFGSAADADASKVENRNRKSSLPFDAQPALFRAEILQL